VKILQIIPSISLIYGGPSQMIRGLSAALAAQGHDVTILTTTSNGDNGQPPLDVPLNTPVEQDGYSIRYYPCAPFKRYKYSAPLITWLQANAHQYDIAHIHALFSPLSSIAARTCRKTGLPYILRPLGTLDPTDLKKKAIAKKLYATLLEAPNIGSAAALHFTSHKEQQTSERFGHSPKDFILPIGVTLPALQDQNLPEQLRQEYNLPADCFGSSQSKRPLLLFLSRIAPKKGFDLLLPALQQLINEGLDFHLILAGGNPQDPAYEQSIYNEIDSSNLKEHVTKTGFVKGDRKRALLTLADLFVLPSYYENFGIAAAEALAAGIPPVISSGVDIHKDVTATESGWVHDCTLESLTQQLRHAIKSPAEREIRSQNAVRCAADRYGWDAIAQTLQGHYQQILGSTRDAA